MRTCLDIAGDVAVDCNIDRPTALFGSSDPNAVKLLRAVQKSGLLLAKRHNWQALVVQHTFTTTATEAQADGLPSDYDRLNYATPIFNTSDNSCYFGPQTGRAWVIEKYGIVPNILGRWRIINGVLNLLPAPAAGITLALEYISANWVTKEDASSAAEFEGDNDTPKIPDHLIELDAVWRWKHQNGLDYAEDMATFERELETAAARDGGLSPIVPASRREDFISPTWPGTITVS